MSRREIGRDEPPGDGAANVLSAAVTAGEPVIAILGAPPDRVRAVIDRAAMLTDPLLARIVRLDAGDGPSLTMPRIIEALAGQVPGTMHGDDDEMLVRAMTGGHSDTPHVLLVIERSELLPRRTLAFLQVATTVFGARSPRLQIMFGGAPGFADILSNEEYQGLNHRIATYIELPDPADEARSVARRGWALHLGAVLAASMAIGGAVAFYMGDKPVLPTVSARVEPPAAQRPADLPRLSPQLGKVSPPVTPPPAELPAETAAVQAIPALPAPVAPPPAPIRSTTPAPAPGLPEPAPAVPPLPPAPDPTGTTTPNWAEKPAPPPPDDAVRLRAEFEEFLDQSGFNQRVQSPGRRAQLFQEYLRWRARESAARPGGI